MKEIEQLLICNSNLFIPVTLTIVLKNPHNRYLVLSDIENIKIFFESINLPNVTYHHYEFKPHRDGWLSFIKGKRELWNFVSQYSIRQVVFFHAEYGEMANWLIKQLSKSCPIIYCKLYDSIPVPKAKWSIKKIRILLAQRILWGMKMDILTDVYDFPSLPESFYKDINSKTLSIQADTTLNNAFLKEKLNKYNIKGNIVLLTGTVIKDEIYKEEEYVPFINNIIESIGFDNIVSKCHPRYNSLYGLENDLKQVPSFIPGNILLDCFNCYIGVESTLLVEAAIAGKISISIIDWLKPRESIRNNLHVFFENRLQGKGKIYYPKSMGELKKIVSSINTSI